MSYSTYLERANEATQGKHDREPCGVCKYSTLRSMETCVGCGKLVCPDCVERFELQPFCAGCSAEVGDCADVRDAA